MKKYAVFNGYNGTTTTVIIFSIHHAKLISGTVYGASVYFYYFKNISPIVKKKIFSYDYKYVSGNPQTKNETYNTQ